MRIEKIISYLKEHAILSILIGGIVTIVSIFVLTFFLGYKTAESLEILKVLSSIVLGMVSAIIAYLVYQHNRISRKNELELREIETLRGFMPYILKSAQERNMAKTLIQTYNRELVSKIEKIEGLLQEEAKPEGSTLDGTQSAPLDKWLEQTVDINHPSKGVTYDDKVHNYSEFVVTRKSHTLDLPKKFRMGIYPVTNELFFKFIRDGGYRNNDFWDKEAISFLNQNNIFAPASASLEKDDHPVVGICYYEAKAFCKWLQHKHPQKDWRWCLPTEDMWEFVARAEENRLYPWGFDGSKTAHCNSIESGRKTTTPVTGFPSGKSKYDCYDMAGNVWEFVEAREPKVLKRGTSLECVLRGGSFKSGAIENHYRLEQVRRTLRADDFGFRVAQEYLDPNNAQDKCD